MRKIAFFIPKLNGGGAERVVVNLVNELSKRRDLEIFLFVSRMGGEYDDLVGKEVNFESLGERKLIFSILPLLKKIKKNNIECLITGMPFPNIAGILCKKIQPSLKLIVTEHNDLRNQISGSKVSIVDKLTPFAIKLFYHHADGVIAVSKGVADFLIKNNYRVGKRIRVIYNPIIYKEMYDSGCEKVSDYTFRDDYVYVVSVARLTEQKNLRLFIEIINSLKVKTKVKGLIIGQGEELESLIEYTNKLNCNNDIDFLGFKKNPYKYIKQCDLLLMTSLWEGFGNVLVESVALGTKIASVDCPSGPSEIIESLKYGCLLNGSEVNEYTDEIISYLNGEHVIDKVRLQRFHVSNIADNYLDMINKL